MHREPWVRNTAALVGAAEESGRVTVIGHPDDDRYPLIRMRLRAAENHTAIELNNGSLNRFHENQWRRISEEVLEACRKYRTMVLMGRTVISLL